MLFSVFQLAHLPEVVLYGTLGIILISSSSAKQKTYFLKSPGKVTYGHEGSDVTMEWDFSIEARPPSGTKIYDLIFGEWVSMPPGSGYVKHKILYMDDSRDRVKKRPGYEDKVDWSANVPQCVNCSTKVTLHNLTRTDFKKYGIDIFLGLHRNQLKHWTELRAPPRIINWFPLLEVNEGNTTVISCKAEGIPSPFVTLQRGNQTFCNGTEYCEYTIQKARAVDGGEYGCFAEQGKEKSVKRSIQLKVHSKGLKRATAMSASTAISTLIFCLVALAIMSLVDGYNHLF